MSRPSVAIVVLWLALSIAVPARSQLYSPMSGSQNAGNIEGFTVMGKGQVAAMPNRLEVDLSIASSSELTADAIVKYRDAKKRLQDAFQSLKLEHVTIEEQGLLVDQKGAMPNPYYMDYQPNRRTKTEVQLSRKLVVRCSDIRKLDEDTLLQMVAKLLDVAQDAGGQVGPAPIEYSPYYYNPYNRSSTGLVRFILDDFQALQEEAYGKAIDDAKVRAQRLAKLSGVELGPIVAVQEITVPGERGPSSFERTPALDEESATRQLESSKFQRIPIRVELLVRFEVRRGAAGNER